MFSDILKQLRLVDGRRRTAFLGRIEDVVAVAGNTGWGYQDQLTAEFEEWLTQPVRTTRKRKG